MKYICDIICQNLGNILSISNFTLRILNNYKK